MLFVKALTVFKKDTITIIIIVCVLHADPVLSFCLYVGSKNLTLVGSPFTVELSPNELSHQPTLGSFVCI